MTWIKSVGVTNSQNDSTIFENLDKSEDLPIQSSLPLGKSKETVFNKL